MLYIAELPKDLDATKPTEGATAPSELNDSDREVKRVIKNHFNVKSTAISYSLLAVDELIIGAPDANTGDGSITITLPQISTVSTTALFKKCQIINNGDGTINVAPFSGEYINGFATPVVVQAGFSLTCICLGGTSWYSDAVFYAYDSALLGSAPPSAFPGASVVPVTGVSGKLAFGFQPAFRGALAYRDSTYQTLPANQTTAIIFNGEVYDTDTIHDISTNPSRLTVPAGVSKVRLTAQIAISTPLVLGTGVSIYKNNSIGDIWLMQGGGGEYRVNLVSPVLPVSPGDYFELKVTLGASSGATEADNPSANFLAMEIVE